ncbi:hypothetical protein J6590_029115 [Homalodisca vitripennis]|nr:hypothetical protein J6590_029115 [Homalodisca vitripennis]
MTTDKESCKKCPEGKCKKTCPGFNIVSISGAQNLRGCTFINGSLEISIRKGKHQTIAHELEESFKLIEGIRGCLKVSRSFPLVNLKFLRSLETIHGETDLLENGKYSLIILDNQNLQELWDIKSTFRIKNGRLFFHYNPKLCHHYIETLIARSNVTNITSYEIDQESNGDKFACNTTRVDLIFTEITSKSVLINIVLPNSTIPRPSLHRFAVHFTESESTNLTVFQEEPNECVESRWRVRDIILESGQYISTIQTHLQPYTQYAFYVKTYSVHSTMGESPIYYVRTRPSKPSEMTLTLAYSNESSTIVLQWEPPRHPNGLLSDYIVTGFLQKDDRALLDQRDYCKHPLEEEPPEDLPLDILTNIENETESCCYKNQITYRPKGEFGTLCDNSRQGLLPIDLSQEDSSITCNKYFYESIYESSLIMDNPKTLKNDTSTAAKNKFQKRDKSTKSQVHAEEDKLKTAGKQFPNAHWKEDLSFSEMARNDSNGYVINNLHHFSKYTVMVRVCRERFMDEKIDYENRCSKHEIVTVRTLKKDDADIIDSNGISHEVTNEDGNIVMISWEEPEDPNGIIVSFQIEHRRSDLQNAKAITECLTHENYIKNGKKYYLRGLHPGKYVYRLRTVSLAGPGTFTDLFEFEIESSKHGYYYTLIILITVVILLAGTGGFYYIMVRKQPTMDLDKLLASAGSEHTLSSPPDVEDSWEIERENIQIVKEIGKGSFGKVYEGVLHPEKVPCAVKTVTDTDHTSAFWNEITVMKRAAGVPHIVQLLGIISRASPPVVVMELLALGDLKSFLRSTRAAPPLKPTLLRMAAQVADAMVFMEMNRFVHRDLAARNCMVHEDHTVKVGDFGLTRDVYTTDYYKKSDNELLPIRWMAPESLRDGVFTSRSDVWSYGVVLWEIATLAEQPYQGMSNEQVLIDVIDGKTLVPPESCSQLFKTTMTLCWSKNPALRPSFRRVMTKLEKNIDAMFKCTSYYHTTVVAGESSDDIIVCESDEPQVSLIF